MEKRIPEVCAIAWFMGVITQHMCLKVWCLNIFNLAIHSVSRHGQMPLGGHPAENHWFNEPPWLLCEEENKGEKKPLCRHTHSSLFPLTLDVR